MLSRLTIKVRLLGALALLTAVLVLIGVSGWNGMNTSNQALNTVYQDRVVPLRDLKAISDDYAVLVVDTSHKVRSGAISWQEAESSIAEAKKRIATNWDNYTATTLTEEERGLVETLVPRKEQADAFIGRLESVIEAQDRSALVGIIETDLYGIIDPVTEIITDLAELQETVSEQEYLNAESASQKAGSVMAVLALIGLAIVTASVLTVLFSVIRPFNRMTAAMTVIAGGAYKTEVPYLQRQDEIGELAAALNIFKENGLENQRMQQEREEQKKQAEAEKRQILAEMADNFDTATREVIQSVSAAAAQLNSNARKLSGITEQTREQSLRVSSSSEQASTNVQTVAAATEELTSSIDEINSNMSHSLKLAGEAVSEAEQTNGTIHGLNEAADRIGDVVKLIQEIAEQTNLLALNATIEAARAGEAGKGFAVVASEVKALANQTGKATEEIAGQVSQIQAVTKSAVGAIGSIGERIRSINEVVAAVASAAEEQAAATQEISRNVQEAAQGTASVTEGISQVNKGSEETGHMSKDVLDASNELSRQAESLESEVTEFIKRIRAA